MRYVHYSIDKFIYLKRLFSTTKYEKVTTFSYVNKYQHFHCYFLIIL